MPLSLVFFMVHTKTISKPYIGMAMASYYMYKRLENDHLQWSTNQLAIHRSDSYPRVRLLSGWALDSTVHKVCPPGH